MLKGLVPLNQYLDLQLLGRKNMTTTYSLRKKLIIVTAAVITSATLVPSNAAGAPATAIKTTLPAVLTYLSDSKVSSVNYRVIEGTASNLTGTTVDLACLNTVTGDVITTINSNIPVKSGKWKYKLDLRSIAGYNCQLRALPSGTQITGSTLTEKVNSVKAFTGPVVRTTEARWYYSSMGQPGKVWSYDAGVYVTGSKAKYTIWSIEDGGIYGWSGQGDDNIRRTEMVGYGLFSRYRPTMTGPTGSREADLLVDGVQAFLPYNMDTSDMNMTDTDNNTKYKVAFDSKTGAATYTEDSPLFKCANPEAGTVYSYLYSCPDQETVKLGVSWQHEVKFSADGLVATVTDTFTSEDKKKHSVQFDVYSSFANVNGFRFGKSGDFGDSSSDVKSKLAGLGVKYNKSEATSGDNPILQLVFKTTPTSTWRASNGYFYSRYSVSIAAGKSTEVNSGATLITDDSKAAAQITLAGK